MNSFELSKAGNWAIGMIAVSVILLIVTVILHVSGWPGETWFWGVSRDDGANIRTNFVLTLLAFIPGSALLAAGVALHVVCSAHERFMRSYDERMMKMLRPLKEDEESIVLEDR